MLTVVVALFGAGLASFAAPCALPLVPVYLGLLTGELASGHARVAVRTTVAFVAGFTVVFVAVGAAAGAAGALLGDERGAWARVGGALLVVAGLTMTWLGGARTQRTVRLRLPLPSGTVLRPLVVGLVFGAAWTPCAGPLLGAALVAATGTGSAWRGAAALTAYAGGLGAPFLVLGAGLAWTPGLHRALRRASPVLARLGAAFLVVVGGATVAGRLGDVLAWRP